MEIRHPDSGAELLIYHIRRFAKVTSGRNFAILSSSFGLNGLEFNFSIQQFFYLSDFAYGQRLVFFKGSTQMAFVNFIEDKVYNEYIDIVKKVIGEAENNEEIMEFVQASFGITCDKINNYKVDFLCGQKKCLFCGSDKFERNMIEPESLVNMEVSEITHKTWKKLSEEQKVFEVKKAWGEFGNSF